MRAQRALMGAAAALALALALASKVHAQSAADPDLRNLEPFVMIIVDSSGSMERLTWKPGQTGIPCECITRGCTECLPACSSSGLNERNRWVSTLEALTGSFNTPDPVPDTRPGRSPTVEDDEFQCASYDRTWTGAYDSGYFMPYHQPWRCQNGLRCTSIDREAELVALTPVQHLQSSDGLLDQYASSLRFGLMTFDGIPTWTESTTGDLVSAPTFTTNLALSESERGLWSYAGPHRIHYPNCPEDYMMDTGVRSETANANNNDNGGLISVNWTGCANPPCDTDDINSAVQKALLNARSFGGTPIAAALDDLYFHYKNDLSDTFGGCRDRYAFLISDGEPDPDFRDYGCDCKQKMNCPADENPDDMQCPYPLPEDVAKDLVTGRVGDQKQIEKLFVVGVAIPTTAAVPTFTPRDRLEAIAIQGGTTALFPTSQTDLFAGLNTTFNGLVNPTSRSVPVFASNPKTRQQYQISTGFQKAFGAQNAGVAPPWTGLIERQRIGCGTGTPQPEDLAASQGDLFHETLNAQSTRTLWTVLPDGGASITGTVASGLAATVHNCGMASADRNTPFCDYKTLDDLVPTDFGLTSGDSTGAADIRNWMYGRPGTPAGDQRATRKLGDIYHSSPTVARAPSSSESADLTYSQFLGKDEVKTRPLVMYVGTNDGILHAFAVEPWKSSDPENADSPHTNKDIKAGEELWGFVPPMKLSTLDEQLTGHQFSMDATPVVKDVYYTKPNNSTGTADDYATVLIVGMRRGGAGYVALDVSDPFAPRFLWQFAPSDMGYTYGKAAIAQLEITWDPGTGTTTTEKRAVAILPGGSGIKGTTADCGGRTSQQSYRKAGGGTYTTLPDTTGTGTAYNHRADVTCWKGREPTTPFNIVPGNGRALYFVDVLTGTLIKEIRLKATGSTGAFVFPSPIIGSPTVYPDTVGVLAQEGYVTDADGVIWRMDFTAKVPGTNTDWDSGWTVRPFHDIFWDANPADGEVSYETPILSVDDKKRLVLLLGTGDSDNFDKPTVKNRVVSITRMDTTPSGGTTTPEHIQAAMNWEKVVKTGTYGFVPSEMVTGSMALFQGRLFFASFISVVTGSDACDLGRGRLWSVDYQARDQNDQNPSGTYGPLMVNLTAAELGRNDSSSGATFFNTDLAGAADNMMVFGLGATQPFCPPGTAAVDSDYFAPNLLQGLPQTTPPTIWLVAQAFGGATRAKSQLGSLKVDLDRPASFTRVGSWAGSAD